MASPAQVMALTGWCRLESNRFLTLEGLIIQPCPVRILNWLLQTPVGDGYFQVIKVLGALLSGLILWHMFTKSPRLALIVAFLFALAYAGVVLWNVSVVYVATRV